jgi:hypothetical protein
MQLGNVAREMNGGVSMKEKVSMGHAMVRSTYVIGRRWWPDLRSGPGVRTTANESREIEIHRTEKMGQFSDERKGKQRGSGVEGTRGGWWRFCRRE